MGKVAFFYQSVQKDCQQRTAACFNKAHFLQTKKWILLQAPHRNQPKCLERQRKKLRRDHIRQRMTTTSSVDYYLIDLLFS